MSYNEIEPGEIVQKFAGVSIVLQAPVSVWSYIIIRKKRQLVLLADRRLLIVKMDGNFAFEKDPFTDAKIE
jgi:hypothetical protein